jgi:hypothetical protein
MAAPNLAEALAPTNDGNQRTIQTKKAIMRQMFRYWPSLFCFFLLSACSRGAIEFGQDGYGPDGLGGAGGMGSNQASTSALSNASATGTSTSVGSTGNATSSASGGPPPTSTGSGGEMVCTSFGDPCTDCVSKSCAKIWCDCANNDACTQLFGCYGQCQGNDTCNQACSSANPDGISDVLLVSGCAGTVCDASCSWGNNEFDACDECIATDCKSPLNACLANPNCLKLWGCLGECAELDLSCQKGCYDTFPSAVPLLQKLLQCTTKECPTEC